MLHLVFDNVEFFPEKKGNFEAQPHNAVKQPFCEYVFNTCVKTIEGRALQFGMKFLYALYIRMKLICTLKTRRI